MSPLRIKESAARTVHKDYYGRKIDRYVEQQAVLANDKGLLERAIACLPKLGCIEVVSNDTIGFREFPDYGFHLRVEHTDTSGDWTLPLLSTALRSHQLSTTHPGMSLVCRGDPSGPALCGIPYLDPNPFSSDEDWGQTSDNANEDESFPPMSCLTRFEIHLCDSLYDDTTCHDSDLFLAFCNIFEDSDNLEHIAIFGAFNSSDPTCTNLLHSIATSPLPRLRTVQIELFEYSEDHPTSLLREHERTLEVVKFFIDDNVECPSPMRIVSTRWHQAMSSLVLDGLGWAALKTFKIDMIEYGLGVFELAPFLKGHISVNPIPERTRSNSRSPS